MNSSDKFSWPSNFGQPGRALRMFLISIALLLAATLTLLAQGDLLRGPFIRQLAIRLDRRVAIRGLHINLLTTTPEITFSGLQVGQPSWAGAGDMIVIPSGAVRVRWSLLLSGTTSLASIRLTNPVIRLQRDAHGRANWHFTHVPLKLPAAENITVIDGRVAADDALTGLRLTGRIAVGGERQAQGQLHAAMQGSIAGQDLSLQVDGARPKFSDVGIPYLVALAAKLGESQFGAHLELRSGDSLDHYRGAIKVSGPDLAQLSGVAQRPLPSTRAYQFTARLEHEQTNYSFTDVAGRVGRSDLEGTVSILEAAKRRHVQVELTSRQLEFADLWTLLGGGPPADAAKQPTVSKVKSSPMESQLLSAVPWSLNGFRAFDADVHYRAASAHSPVTPLRELNFGLRLARDALSIDPLQIRFAHGLLDAHATLDTRHNLPTSTADVQLSGFHVEDVLKYSGAIAPLKASLDGRLIIQGHGRSPHEIAESASGTVQFRIGQGTINRRFAQLIGNAGGGLAILLPQKSPDTALRCGAVNLKGTGGRFALSQTVIDTGVASIAGAGTIDLGKEEVDLRITGSSKQPDLLLSFAPIFIAGSLRHPHVHVEPIRVATQTASGLFSFVLKPLGKVLPFLKGKPAPDVDCFHLASARG